MKNSRKSQAAMEFLMTYGWAILVVLVALGALAYFGFLSPDRFLPSKCTLTTGISCVDHRADGTTGTVQVILRNGLGFDITGVAVTIEDCPTVAAIAAGDCILGQTTLNNGDECTFESAACSPVLITGAKYSGDITVAYTNAETSLAHTARGSITTRSE